MEIGTRKRELTLKEDANRQKDVRGDIRQEVAAGLTKGDDRK